MLCDVFASSRVGRSLAALAMLVTAAWVLVAEAPAALAAYDSSTVYLLIAGRATQPGQCVNLPDDGPVSISSCSYPTLNGHQQLQLVGDTLSVQLINRNSGLCLSSGPSTQVPSQGPCVYGYDWFLTPVGSSYDVRAMARSYFRFARAGSSARTKHRTGVFDVRPGRQRSRL